MSTLPKLGNIFRAQSSALTQPRVPSGFGQPPISQTQTQALQPVNPISNVQNASSVAANQQINMQIQSIRETTLRRYEKYVSTLRTLDRNFTLSMKKIDQNKSRVISRITDGVSALSSEIQQLKNQSMMLNRRLKNIKKMQDATCKDGLTNILRPLNDGFKSFGEEFDKAQKNVDVLFYGLESRVGNILENYKAINPITTNVIDLKTSVNELLQSHSQTSELLESTRDEIMNLLEEQRSHVHQQINERMLALGSKIQILEQRSAKALDQSQNVIAESQTSQFDLRKAFDTAMEQSASAYKERLDGVRASIAELAQTRFAQADSIRARLTSASDNLSKLRHKSMKQMVENGSGNRVSLRPEIDALRQRCENLEKMLAARGIQVSEQPSAKMFYQVQDDGSVKYITVTADGQVVM